MKLRITIMQGSRTGQLCEDSVAISGAEVEGGLLHAFRLNQPLCLAMSDGASQSCNSGIFSRLLVDAVVSGCLELQHPDLKEQVRESAESWKQTASQFLDGLNPVQEAAMRESLERGAAATLATVRLWIIGGDLLFQAATLGDTCVIIHRKRRESGASDICLPSIESEMTGIPNLLYTSTEIEADYSRIYHGHGQLRHGDVLIVATDGLSRWYLGPDHDVELARRRKLKALRRLIGDLHRCEANKRQDRFDRWVARRQENDGMDSDDISMACIECIGESA